jgi:hypothetical protein
MLISPEEKEEVLKIFPKVKSPQCRCGKVQDRLFHAGRGDRCFFITYIRINLLPTVHMLHACRAMQFLYLKIDWDETDGSKFRMCHH